MPILTGANIASIANAMLGVFKTGGPALAQYVESEAQKFAQSIETIGQLVATNQIGQPEAAAQLAVQKAASQTVLTSAAGIAELLAVQAINAGLQAVAAIVNQALGFALI
jgi:hypothetical protein